MPDTLLVKKFFLISNRNLLEGVSSCPIACYLGQETNPHVATTSWQVVVENNNEEAEMENHLKIENYS